MCKARGEEDLFQSISGFQRGRRAWESPCPSFASRTHLLPPPAWCLPSQFTFTVALDSSKPDKAEGLWGGGASLELCPKASGLEAWFPATSQLSKLNFLDPMKTWGFHLPLSAELEVDGLPPPNCFAALTWASSELSLGVTPLTPILA